MIEHLYDRVVQTIGGPLCHANGIAWCRDRKRLQKGTSASLLSLSLSLLVSLSPFLSSSLSTAVLHREHRLLARARPTTRVNLVCIWSGPVRLAGVQSMDVIHCSATESQADGRTDGRVGEEGREERSRGRDTASKAIVARDLCRETSCYRWHRYGYTYGGPRIVL